MSYFYALVGNFNTLAMAELASVCIRYHLPFPKPSFSKSLICLDLDDKVTPKDIQSICGSVIKIYKAISLPPQTTLPQFIYQSMTALKLHRCALSSLNSSVPLDSLIHEIKTISKKNKYTLGIRHLPTPTQSAGIDAHHPEFLVGELSQPQLYQSLEVQNINWWSKKDYGRPVSQPKAGMLPPKIARQLVNIALPQPITRDTLILDPFCGVGTLLAEALELGSSVIGSDINALFIEQAQQNLDWFVRVSKTLGTYQLHQADAQKSLSFLASRKLDAVVFEGFLGPPDIKSEEIDDYVHGLTNLYLGVFKRLNPLLKAKGRLVAAVPAFVSGSRVKTLKRLIDRCENLGYTPVYEPLWYFRPQARIRRHILVWQKKSSKLFEN